MSVSLQKGQKVSLSKEHAGLSKMMVGLGWDEAQKAKGGFFAPKPKPIDCDASALLLKKAGCVIRAILFILETLAIRQARSSIWAIT